MMRATICALVALAAVPATADAELRIGTLSTRPDTVTGGDALVRVHVPRDVSPDEVVVRLDGRDVTGAFRARGSSLTGLVTGLADGRNRLTAHAGRHEARLVLRNHPVTGPVFSGPQEQPFVCETESFELPVIGGNLGPPLDADCSIATRLDHFYRTTAGEFAPWPEGASSYPADLAYTTTTLGDRGPVHRADGDRNGEPVDLPDDDPARPARRRGAAGTAASSTRSAAAAPTAGTARARAPAASPTTSCSATATRSPRRRSTSSATTARRSPRRRR